MAGTAELDRWIAKLQQCEYLSEAEVRVLCAKAREILVEEANVQVVQAPVTVRCKTNPHARFSLRTSIIYP